MLFRATRGNMLFNQAPGDVQIMDPISTETVFSILLTLFLVLGSRAIEILFNMHMPIFFVVVCVNYEMMCFAELLVSLRFVLNQVPLA